MWRAYNSVTLSVNRFLKIGLLSWNDFGVKEFLSEIGAKKYLYCDNYIIYILLIMKGFDADREKIGFPSNRFWSPSDSQVQSDSVGIKLRLNLRLFIYE